MTQSEKDLITEMIFTLQAIMEGIYDNIQDTDRLFAFSGLIADIHEKELQLKQRLDPSNDPMTQ